MIIETCYKCKIQKEFEEYGNSYPWRAYNKKPNKKPIDLNDIVMLCEVCQNSLNVFVKKSVLDFIQPERSKREDSQQCEMRCSEHGG